MRFDRNSAGKLHDVMIMNR